MPQELESESLPLVRPLDDPGDVGDDDPPPLDAPDAFGVFAISAAGRTGLDTLLAAWWSQLLGMRKAIERPGDKVALP